MSAFRIRASAYVNPYRSGPVVKGDETVVELIDRAILRINGCTGDAQTAAFTLEAIELLRAAKRAFTVFEKPA